jgi:hypothetical protein
MASPQVQLLSAAPYGIMKRAPAPRYLPANTRIEVAMLARHRPRADYGVVVLDESTVAADTISYRLADWAQLHQTSVTQQDHCSCRRLERPTSGNCEVC